MLKMLPHIVNAIQEQSTQNVEIPNIDGNSDNEDNANTLRETALNSRNRRTITNTNHQHPADILPAVSQKTIKLIKDGEFVDFSSLLPTHTLHSNSGNIQLEITPNFDGEQSVIKKKTN